jgi:RNA polymerase sigma-70 factor, ECF subfamily
MNQPSAEQIREWADRISRSDRQAFNALFRSLYYPLTYFAYRYTQCHDQACDIVQDVFVSVWQDRNDIDPQQSLKSYLYKLVRNRSLNHLRDHSKRMMELDIVNIADPGRTMITGNDEGTDGVEEMAGTFRIWINELSDRRREAFELSRFEGLDHHEIADVMNLSVKTVNNHIVDALSHLRKRYNNHSNSKNGTGL